MATAENKKEPTATEAYQTAKNDIANLMGFVTNELTKRHEKIDWGKVGNLQHVRCNLIETVAFLSELEEADIEETLNTLRSIVVVRKNKK